jgi:hypothetical protein
MNIFALILGLVPGIVKGIQTVVGDKANGATKAQMAQDALNAAVTSASSVLTGTDAIYGQAAAQLAQLAINQTVAISQASGVYEKWTAVATAAQQDAGVAQAVAGLVASVQAPKAA